MKYHLITLGCQMNMSDSERVSTVISQMGYEWTDDENQADLLGILACSVRQKAIDKVYSRIQKWNKAKNKRNLITFVSGCMLPSDREKFLKLFDLVFPISELNELPEMISQYGIASPLSLNQGKRQTTDQPNEVSILNPSFFGQGKNMSVLTQNIDKFWGIHPNYNSDFEAFIPIQNGCDKFCTFCAVPYTRGREVSRSSNEIMDELHRLVENGYKSITLLGQNVNSYGLDKKGDEIRFPQLLKQIGEYGNQTDKLFWVYFTSPHPRDMTDEVIEVISSYNCLAKQIHLPAQSGDDGVLIRMNRNHTIEKYHHIIRTIRNLIPQATIFTDIIVGFNGETNEQFENTRKLMQDASFNMAYIAMYSPRPGAASSRWEDDVPHEIKKTRYHILSEELRKTSYQYNKSMVGKEFKVLVRGKDRKDGYLSAYTEGRIVTRFPSKDETLIGKFIRLKITSASELSVEGEQNEN